MAVKETKDKGVPERRRGGWRIPLLVFLSLLCLYSLILSTRFEGYERGFFGTAYTFVTTHEFHMGQDRMYGTRTVDGKRYAAYVLQSILDVPLVAAGMGLDSAFAKIGLNPQLTFFFAKGINALLTALTAVVIYLFGMRLFGNERTSVALAFIYGICTMAMPYATIGMDPLVTFLTFWGFYLINRSAKRGRPWLFLLTGVVFGLAMGAKNYTPIVYPVAGVYLYLLHRRRPVEGLKRGLIMLAVGGALGLVPFFWYNYLRSGNILDWGWTSGSTVRLLGGSRFGRFFENLYASFFSAGKSFFLYSPPLIFIIAGLRKMMARAREEALAFAALSGIVLFFFCNIQSWADEVWATRYYLVFVPFLVVPLGYVIEGLGQSGLFMRVSFKVAVLTGFLIQIPGSLVYYGHHISTLVANNLYSVQNAFYIPALSHIPINIYLIAGTITKKLTGVFPTYYYVPRSNIAYRYNLDAVPLKIDPNMNYINVWWYQILDVPYLGGTSRTIVISLVLLLLAGFLAFGIWAWILASRKSRAA